METVITSKATVKEISATSRASVKVGDSYYTVEYNEVRSLPMENMTDEEIQNERELLWATVNNECDSQIEDIIRTFKKK